MDFCLCRFRNFGNLGGRDSNNLYEKYYIDNISYTELEPVFKCPNHFFVQYCPDPRKNRKKNLITKMLKMFCTNFIFAWDTWDTWDRGVQANHLLKIFILYCKYILKNILKKKK